MSLSLLSTSDRKRTLRRKARRTGRSLIAHELHESLIDEEPDYFGDDDATELALYQISEHEIELEKRRRKDIVNGINPDTGESFTLKEFEKAIDKLDDLTIQEKNDAHSTWFNIEYSAAYQRKLEAEYWADARQSLDAEFATKTSPSATV